MPLVNKSLEICLKEAEKQDMILAVENCPKGTDPLVTLRIIKEFNSPHLKLCPDIGNIREDIRYSTFEPLLPYACHIHAKTYNFNNEGEEKSINYKKVLGMIKKAGYDKYISIEFEGEDNEFTGVKNSFALIKKYS